MGKTLRRVDYQTKGSDERDAFCEHHGSDHYVGDLEELLGTTESLYVERLHADPEYDRQMEEYFRLRALEKSDGFERPTITVEVTWH